MNLSIWLAALPLVLGQVSGDLGGIIDGSGEADFGGEQLVSCETPDGTRNSLFQVAQVDGTVVAWTEGASESVVAVSPGRTAIATGGEVAVTAVESEALSDAANYELGAEREVTFLGRSATEVPLVRDGVERVRLTVDDATGAIVQTVSFDGEGEVYCDRRLLSFQTEGIVTPPLTFDEDVDSVVPTDSTPTSVPLSNSGFQMLDTYSVEGGTMSYFSDGFFTAGVVVTARPIDLPEGAVSVDTDTGSYLRDFEAGTVTVTWSADDSNFAVIGDLPPDLLEEFLGGLPQPTESGFFGRLWDRLFG